MGEKNGRKAIFMKELRKELNIKKKKMSQNKSYVKHWIIYIAGLVIGFLIATALITGINLSKEEPKQICPSCPDCRHPQIIVVNESQIIEKGGYLYYELK